MPDVTAGTCSASQEGVRRRKNDTHAAARSWDPFRELEEISNRFTRLSRWPIGLVTKRLATRKIEKPMYRRDDEGELTSWVFSSSSTAPKKLVAQHVAGLVGLPATRVLTGAELDQCHDEALSLSPSSQSRSWSARADGSSKAGPETCSWYRRCS
jgi:hypothetical protein